MKHNFVHQEILLITTSTFSEREWCRSDSSDSSQRLSQIEQLEEACWSGLLNNLLPEIIEHPAPDKKLFVWQVRHGESFLQVDLSEFPVKVAEHLSINAHLFLPSIPAN